MKQLFQNLRTGETLLVDLPCPQVEAGCLLIQSQRSLISLGTERMLVNFSKGSLLAKAQQQPDKVRQVLDKIKTDGLKSTFNSVFAKLDEPMPLGYCNAGTVMAVGENIHDIQPGDRVASNGSHAEIVCVPRNLVAKIPDNVSFDEASFTVIGSIALQGLRLASLTLGETVVVIGLGLVGQLAAQLARANGCKVIGFDVDCNKVNILNKFGCSGYLIDKESNPVAIVEETTKSIGADAVIITASAKSDSIVSQAARMSRKRGRIVLVGIVDLNLDRSEFYAKELSFQVSCSYGPGRYDTTYEEKGQDYPRPFVRWTENRNFEAVLDCIKEKRIDIQPLISEIVEFDNSAEIYKNLGNTNSIATILKYSTTKPSDFIHPIVNIHTGIKSGSSSIAVIGAGNFAEIVMLPALIKSKAKIKYICSLGGASSTHLAKKFGVPYSTTDYNAILNDKEIGTVMIATRPHLHASMTIAALKAKKDVFVEKPLAITRQELVDIIDAYKASHQSVVVGFNRRFSPFTIKAIKLIGTADKAINVTMIVNAGAIPVDSWIHDLSIGGGRIVGEACHFIDLFRFLCGSRIVSVCATSLGTQFDKSSDNVILLLKAENGSQASINYFSNGSKKYPKEDIRIFSQGTVLYIDNFRKLTGFGFRSNQVLKTPGQDKGHLQEFSSFINNIDKSTPIIPFNEIVNVSEASIAGIESMQTGSWISLHY